MLRFSATLNGADADKEWKKIIIVQNTEPTNNTCDVNGDIPVTNIWNKTTFTIGFRLKTIAELGLDRSGFPKYESTDAVMSWAKAQKNDSESGYVPKDLKKNWAYESYLLDKPLMTNAPTFKISNMLVVGDKMQLEVSARTNESFSNVTDNIVDLAEINGALYLQTSETLVDEWGDAFEMATKQPLFKVKTEAGKDLTKWRDRGSCPSA